MMSTPQDGEERRPRRGYAKLVYTRRLQYEEELSQNKYSEETELVDEQKPRGQTRPDRAITISGVLGYRKRLKSTGDEEEEDVKDEHDGELDFPFTKLDLFATVCSIVFFLYDFISDIVLAEEYFRHKRFTAFWFTSAFILFPALLSNGQSIKWYWLDYKKEKNDHAKEKEICQNGDNPSHQKLVRTSCCTWFCRIFFTFPLMLGPAVRNIEYMYHGIRSWSTSLKPHEKRYHHRQMLFEDNDASLIRMLEAFLEAAPQLVLQLYIILTEEEQEDKLYLRIIRPAAMIGSWIGVSWSLVSYHRALRAMHSKGPTDAENIGMTLCGAVGYFLWRACEVGPRVIILALFASYFTYWLLVAAVVHWMCMSFWLICQKTKFYEKKIDKFIFNFTIGYILIFCFLNVRDGHTRFRVILYYMIFYTENFSMLLAWTYFTGNKSVWFYFVGISVVSAGFLLQIVFQITYYLLCHPRKDQIPCCLSPRKNYNCFQSICHSLGDDEMEPEYMMLDPLGEDRVSKLDRRTTEL